MSGIPELIALDIDGTLLLEDESLSPGVHDAVARAQAAGAVVTLATGRSWGATLPVLRRLELTPEYVVCSNGAVILRRDGDGEYLRHLVEVFDPRQVLELLFQHLPDGKFMVELDDGTRLYTEPMPYWNLDAGRQANRDELGEQPVSRVVVVSEDHEEDSFAALIERIGLHQVTYSVGWTAWLDIAPLGVDKGSALQRVADLLKITPEAVLVAGDGRNDLGMFAWARERGGRAVAMGNAVPEALLAATEHTTSVYDGGVATLLNGIRFPRP